MVIERDAEGIRFHDMGTLTSVTRWISTHDEGLAEWLKNARRAYQPDRTNVEDSQRVAVFLFKDAVGEVPARIGLLDVGGATLEDVTRWSTWQDPNASTGRSGFRDEETQGNGGKAYMYRLFAGPTRILGIRDAKRNCKGLDGSPNTLDRGTPGFMPDVASGRDLPVSSWEYELAEALEPYGMVFGDLPRDVQTAVDSRASFTLVEGAAPAGFYRGRINAEDLVEKALRHDQSTLAVQQIRIYAIHNGRLLHAGKPLELERIASYPGFERPVVYEIPEQLPDDNGSVQSTTLSGTRSKGRLILYTSCDDMFHAYKKLRPRWKITYRAESEMIGSKPVSELVPSTPGSYFIYGTVELSALRPDYVELGRKRPNDGPLVSAIDLFVAEKVRALAKLINEQRRHELDQQELDAVHNENRRLNNFKNQFLPDGGLGGDGGLGTGGAGRVRNGTNGQPRDYGTSPEFIELGWDPTQALYIGVGVRLHVDPILLPRALDATGRLVPQAEIEWCSADRHVATFGDRNRLCPVGKGSTKIWARVRSAAIESPKIQVEVWNVDHVLLTPRTLEIAVGKRKEIIAEVTNDDGYRATNVFLNWAHDADDPLIVRIQPTGWVTGNRPGMTTITAGAGYPASGGVWARIGAQVKVVLNPDQPERGGGFPQLLVTGRDIDPATGEIRQGDPDQPALWQEVSDYQHNIWWLNLESPEANFLFSQREENVALWRAFHAQKVVDMVIQVHMRQEFDAKADAERPDLWNRHKAVLELYQVLIAQSMWDKLKPYVLNGGELQQP